MQQLLAGNIVLIKLYKNVPIFGLNCCGFIAKFAT